MNMEEKNGTPANAAVPVEIERKFVIRFPNLDCLSVTDGYTVSHITQTYLLSAPHVTHRVRRREYEGRVVYTETKKIRIDKISAFEDEREITAEEYEELMHIADPAAIPVVKTRHTVPHGDLTLEIDVYPAWKHSCIMEIELPSREYTIELPSYITVLADVTGDKRYSNAAMARSFPPEIV